MQLISRLTTAFLITCVACTPGWTADVRSVAGDPSTSSRTVDYHDTDIIPISTEIRFTTLIELPKEESILEVTCGDKEFWPVNWTGNLAYVKPAKPGSRTNINLITASGNVYSFLATEVSTSAGAHADLKVFVNPSDQSAIVAMKDKPRFVSADAVEGYKRAADQAQQQLTSIHDSAQKELEREKAELRANYPATIKHDYKYSAHPKNPFNVTAIYHDDKFTYIEATPQEAPAVYEVRDGKPSLIQYEFDQKTGRYTIPKVLDDGYLRVGKAELKFHRESNG
ncbi:MAG TPA: TrbG/VirB9 family P-type conjugative transfer protein [Bryobacteraceae bacterium]|nr:TrbG/VirB9 family P-type conjugative transfer protein [Bryobacteraceae bacterium]